MFENCIVDASIFFGVLDNSDCLLCVVFVVVKLLRAHGGCLGIRGR